MPNNLNSQDILTYLRSAKPTKLHQGWGEERYRPVAEEVDRLVKDPQRLADFAIANNINSFQDMAYLQGVRKLTDERMGEMIRDTKEKNVFAQNYGQGKDITQTAEFTNWINRSFGTNTAGAQSFLTGLSGNSAQKNAITKRLLDSYGINNTIADSRNPNVINFKAAGDGSYSAFENDNKRFNPSVWELTDALHDDFLRGGDITQSEKFKNAHPALQKAAIDKLNDYLQNPWKWDERAKHEGYQAYKSGNFTPFDQRFSTPEQLDTYLAQSGVKVPVSAVDAEKQKQAAGSMTSEKWNTLSYEMKERYTQEHGQPDFLKQSGSVPAQPAPGVAATPPSPGTQNISKEEFLQQFGRRDDPQYGENMWQRYTSGQWTPSGMQPYNTAAGTAGTPAGNPPPASGKKPAPASMTPEKWNSMSAEQRDLYLRDYEAPGSSQQNSSTNQPGYRQDLQDMANQDNRTIRDPETGILYRPGAGGMANPWQGRGAQELFEGIKAGMLVPGRDPSINSVWMGLYQNGEATSAQKQAYAMWDAYNKYGRLSANLLFGLIKDGVIRPDPSNPEWMALYNNGQPTAAQVEAYRLWDEYNKKHTSTSSAPSGSASTDPFDITQYDSIEDFYDALNDAYGSTDDEDDIPTRGDDAPAPKTLEQMYKELQDAYNVKQYQTEVQDWNKQLADEEAAFRQQRNAELNKQVPMSVIAGRVSQEERAYMERADFYRRQRDSAQSILESVNGTIDTMLKLRAQDQQTAVELQKAKREALNDYFNQMIALKKEKREENKDQQTQARDAIKILVENFGGKGLSMVDEGTLSMAGFSGLDIAALASSMSEKDRSAMMQMIDTPFGAYMYATMKGDATMAQKAQDWMMMQKNAGKIDAIQYLDGTDTIVPGSVAQIDGTNLSPDILSNCVKYIRSLNIPGFPQSGLLSLQNKIDRLVNGANGSRYPLPGAVGIMDYGKIDPETGINYGHLFYVEQVTKDKITISQTNVPGGRFKRETLSINDPRIKGYYVSSSMQNTKTGGYPSVDKFIPVAYANWAAGDKKQTMEEVAEELTNQFEYANNANKIVVKNYIMQKFRESEKLYEKLSPGVFRDFAEKFSSFLEKPKYDWSVTPEAGRKLSNPQIVKLLKAGVWKPEYAQKNIWELPPEVWQKLDEDEDEGA